MRPPADPALPRIVHVRAAGWNSTEATKSATKEVIARGLVIRQVIGARRSPDGGFDLAMIVTGPLPKGTAAT